MDRKSLLITGFVAVLAAAGVAFYEREIFQLRAELEQSRLREAQAAAALKAASERIVERAAAEARAMAEKAAAERAAAEAHASSARLAAEKAVAERKVAEAAAERTAAIAAARPPIAPSVLIPPAGTGSGLLEQAQALERDGKGAEAVRAYVRAARSGSGVAARRLGEIYDKGIDGVSRDYAESLKWFNAARVLGEVVPAGKSR